MRYLMTWRFLSRSFQCNITCKAHSQQTPHRPKSKQQPSHEREPEPLTCDWTLSPQSATQQPQAPVRFQPSHPGESRETLLPSLSKKVSAVLNTFCLKMSHIEFLSVLKAKPDLNTTLPVRQTASIFKQPVTKVTNHPNNKVKTDPQKAVDQPRQVRRNGVASVLGCLYEIPDCSWFAWICSCSGSEN